MAQLRVLLEEYGADYQTTLDRFMGSESMYLKFLSMLPRDDSVQRLDSALDAGDLNAAFEAAHTLKGVAGNLGLTPLYHAACAIVDPLRRREERDYTPLRLEIQDQYERVNTLLEALRKGR